MWPIVVPVFLLIVANVAILWYWFVVPGRTEHRSTIWGGEDGKVKPTCGSQFLTVLLLCTVDLAVLLMPLMLVYGVIPMVLAYVRTVVCGNRVTYVTASKAASTSKGLAAT